MNDILFVDVETTGLSPERHHIWEVALLDTIGGPVLDTQIRLDPMNIRDAEEDALRIGRFHSRYDGDRAANSLHAAQVIARRTEGKVLAGFNPWFDANFLREFLHEHELAPAWDYRLLDVTTYAAGRLGLDLPSSSRTICEALGIPKTGEEHTALGDAQRSRVAYDLARRGDSLVTETEDDNEEVI